MPRYLDPKSDLVFKKIFGGHPELLKSFLNAILPLPEDCQIMDLAYLPTENIPEIPGFKYTIVDVRCQDNYGRFFIVEMQIQWSRHFMQRMLFNTASLYVRQLNKGENYDQLSPVYGIAIVADVFTDESEWFHHYRLSHTRNTQHTLDDIQLIFLELPKLKPATAAQKKLAVLWLRFLSEINEKTQTVDKVLLETPSIQQAITLTEISAYTPQELAAYETNWDAISAAKTLMGDHYTKGLEEGRQEGLEKGRQEGRQEGLEEGAREKSLHIARALLLKGLDPGFVADSIGLPRETVEQIKNQLG